MHATGAYCVHPERRAFSVSLALKLWEKENTAATRSLSGWIPSGASLVFTFAYSRARKIWFPTFVCNSKFLGDIATNTLKSFLY